MRSDPDVGAILREALGHQQAGKLAEAMRLYERVLEIEPNNGDALHLLALVALGLNDTRRAAQLLKRAVELHPNNATFLNALGSAACTSGDLIAAVQHYRKALQLEPRASDIHFNLGMTLRRLGEPREAAACFRSATTCDFKNVAAHFEASVALGELGELEEAVASCRQAIEGNPELAEAHLHLAKLLHRQGEIDDAISASRKACELRPDLAEAHFHLGCCLWEKRKTNEAIAAYRRALAAQPDLREAHSNLGLALQEAGQFEDAAIAYREALARGSDASAVRLNLALAHEQSGQCDEAIREYGAVLLRDPSHWIANWGRSLALPILYHDERELDACEARWAEGLEHLLEEVSSGRIKDADQALGLLSWKTNFYLHYQGKDHTQLQKRYGQLLTALAQVGCPELCRPMPRREVSAARPMRVAFVGSHLRRQTITKLFGGWIAELDRSKFEVHAVNLSAHPETGSHDLRAVCHYHDFGALPPRRLIEAMAGCGFDVILYLDVGMHFRTQATAAFRLAPTQCCAWGHPVTSGFPSIDWFLSSELMEPPNGEEHYSERLVRLPNLSIFYPFPEKLRGQEISAATGLDADPIAYFCNQSLFKLLPQFDQVYPRIAAKVKNARFWFLRHHSSFVTEKFLHRMRGAFAQAGLRADDHVELFPRLSEDAFLQLTQRADVILDSILWSGGNSSLEALACSKPIVTLPGPLMRGRHTYGILRRARLDELIAGDLDQYVEIAVRLGTDAKWRSMLTEKIREQKPAVFHDRAAIDGLEEFLLKRENAAARRTC